MLSGRLFPHGQVLEPGRSCRQRLWRSQSGLLVPTGGGLRGSGGIRSGRDQPRVRWVPAPEAVVGQFGAAPPAMDGIVPAKIFDAGKNRGAEIGQRERALLVAREALV